MTMAYSNTSHTTQRESIAIDADYYELPEVLRFNKYGGVLSAQERDRVAKSKGLCNKCGKVTHKVTVLRSIPLDTDDVKNGICLICHPEEQSSQRDRLGSLRGAGDTKAAKLLGEVTLPPLTKPGKKRRGSGGRKARFVEFKRNFSSHSESSVTSSERSQTRRSSKHKPAFFRPSFEHTPERRTSNPSGATAFDHGGVVPSNESISMDPLRQSYKRGELFKSGGERHMNSLRVVHHDFSAPKNNEDAWDIVKEMRGNPFDIELLIRKCHELRSIGSNSAGALYEIIEVMRRHPGERNLQFAAIGALWSVSADGDDDAKAEAIDAGAAEVIINSITYFTGDVNLVCWGIGALSSFAEGITGRGSLIHSGVIDTLASVLEKYYKAESKVACAICYWVFRCLLLMVISYDDNLCESFYNSVTIHDVENDRDELAVFIDRTLSKHNIVHLVVAAMASSSMDAQTLSTAFTFLCHVPNESYIDHEWNLLSKVVPTVIEEKSYASFPVMNLLAFAMLCELIKKDPSLPSSLKGTSVAVRYALSKLTPQRGASKDWRSSLGSRRESFTSQRSGLKKKRNVTSDLPPDYIIQDLMIYTLCHTLTYSDTVLAFSESKTALKSAIFILNADKSPMFAKLSCCWIIFGVFRGSDTIKNTSFSRQAAGSIQSAMMKYQSSPHLLTIGFAALSAAGGGISNAKSLVDMIFGLKSKFPQEKSLLREACRFLSKCCESKQDVDYVLSAGGLDLATVLLEDEEKSHGREAVHLVYKFVLFAGADILSLDRYHTILKVRDLAKDNVQLAAEMVYCLTKSVTSGSDTFDQSLRGRSRSILLLKRNDPKGILYPVAETFMFFDFVVEVAEVFGNHRNFMKCACLAIKNIALTARRARLQLEVERPISVVQKALTNLKGLHAPIDAIWAMLGMNHSKLGPKIARDVALSMINCIEGSMGTNGHQFLESVVHASFAVLSFIFSEIEIGETKDGLLKDPEMVEKVVKLVLSIFFSCLDKHGNFPSIFKHGFQLLLSLCIDNDYCSIIIKHGGIVAVIDAMMTNAEDVAIQTSGCKILRSLSEIGDVAMMNVVEADGVDLLLDIMTTPDSDIRIIEEAMRTIFALSVGVNSRSVVELEGGISVISEAMSEFSHSASVHETGLAALCFLASDVDDSVLEESSLFTAVRNALTLHQDNVTIHQNGFALLEMLSLRCNAVRNKIVSSGCINCVIEAVMRKQYPSSVVANAFEILTRLAVKSKGCREIICTPEMLESTIFSMMYHVECYKVQLDGCQLLIKMRTNLGDDCIVKAGGVKASLCAMMAHNASADIQKVACTLLSHLSTHPACFDLDCSSPGSNLGPNILDAILSAMDNFPGSKQLTAIGTLTLEKMVEREEIRGCAKSELPRIRSALRSAMRICPIECAAKVRAIEKYLEQ